MTEVRVLVQFRTCRIQNVLSEVNSSWFCMFLHGEAQKAHFFDQQTLNLAKHTKNIKTIQEQIPY